MARYLFPQDRLVFRYGAPGTPLYSPQGETITIYSNEAGTTLANILDADGNATDSILDIGTDCLIPEFQGPDNATTVWAKNRANQVFPLYAQTGQFLPDSGSALVVTSVNGEHGAVTLDSADVGAYSQTAGTTLAGRVTATESGRLLVANNLSDLNNAGIARTSLGLGGAAVLNVGTASGTVAAGNDSRMTNARTPTSHAATHVAAGSDPVTLTQAQITGLTAALAALLPLTGGTLTGSIAVDVDGTATIAVDRGATTNFAGVVFRTAGIDRWVWQLTNDETNDLTLTDSANGSEVMRFYPDPVNPSARLNGDLRLQGTNKAYRFRRSGGGLDLEGAGADMVVSMWQNGNFTGIQRSYIRMAADALAMQIAGKVEFVDALYGSAKHVLDGTANQVGFYGAAPVSKPVVTGSKASGAALTSLLSALAQLGLITDSTTA